MKAFKNLVVILVLIGLFHSCKKDTPIMPDKESLSIFGEWSWYNSIGGLGNDTLNPTSEGYTQLFKFEEDSNYLKARNKAIIDQGQYTISRGITFYNPDSISIIKFSSASPDMAILRLDNDSLTLGEICLDCFVHYYFRL